MLTTIMDFHMLLISVLLNDLLVPLFFSLMPALVLCDCSSELVLFVCVCVGYIAVGRIRFIFQPG